MLGRCDRLYKSQDVRQPLTQFYKICTMHYTMFVPHVMRPVSNSICISFAASLRVGEMRLTSNSSIDRIIQKQDTFVNHESNQLFIKVKYSKIDQRGSSTTLVVESNPLHNSCPLNNLE